MKGLLAVLAIVAALIFIQGGTASAQTNLELAELVVSNVPRIIAAEQAAYEAGMANQRHQQRQSPLPALPVPPVMTDEGMVQAPNPRPLEKFPVARQQPIAKLQSASPMPNPTARNEKVPVEIRRQEKQSVLSGVVFNKVDIKMEVYPPPADLGNDRKAATWLRPGELLLMERKNGKWSSEMIKTKEVPPGYELWQGREIKS